jgi:DNA-binding winged helix-turn-helix (wHTH) protein
MNDRTRRFYEFGDLRIDTTERELLRNGHTIPLTPKAFDVLRVLVENRGRTIDKDNLLQEVWPDSFVEECNLTKQISALRQLLGDSCDEPRFIKTISKRGYRFIAPVKEIDEDDSGSPIMHEPSREAVSASSHPSLTVPLENIEPVGGAVPLDSNFYIERPADDQLRAAVARLDSIILIKGALQIGKTSLLARGLNQARRSGAKVILTDFQLLAASDLDSSESLFQTLGNLIADQLDLEVFPDSVWKAGNSANMNFERYIRREVLKKIKSPIMWGLDEVDRLFHCSFGNDVFGLFRSWHNLRSLDPEGPWGRLTLAISYATEAHLFITDLNQSPFNVGTQLQLNDFTIDQVEELNSRYGSPLRSRNEVERFYNLVSGHPFLVRKGLYDAACGMDFGALEAQSAQDDGPFGHHLRRIVLMLGKDSELCDVMRGLLRGRPCPNPESFYRLRSAGLIVGGSARDARPRCRLYEVYLRECLTGEGE